MKGLRCESGYSSEIQTEEEALLCGRQKSGSESAGDTHLRFAPCRGGAEMILMIWPGWARTMQRRCRNDPDEMARMGWVYGLSDEVVHKCYHDEACQDSAAKYSGAQFFALACIRRKVFAVWPAQVSVYLRLGKRMCSIHTCTSYTLKLCRL